VGNCEITVMKEQKITISIFLDDVRVALSSTFILMAFLGLGLTRYATHVLEEKPTILDWWYGSTNICVLFDFPPSSYILPAFYTIFLLLWVSMTALLWVRQKQASLEPEAQISKPWYYFLNCLRILEVLSAMYFSTIFAVNPDPIDLAKGNPVTMYIHTVPYLFMLIAFTTSASSDAIYDLFTGFASFKGLRRETKKLSCGWYVLLAYPFILIPPCLFTIFQIINVLIKPPHPLVPWRYIPDQWNATEFVNSTINVYPCLTGDWPNDPTCSGYNWCSNCPDFIPLATGMDYIKTLLIFFPPLIKSAIASIWLRDRIFRLRFTIRPEYVDNSIVSVVDDDNNYVNLETK